MLPLHEQMAMTGRLVIERHQAEARQRRLVAQLRGSAVGKPGTRENGLWALLSRLGDRVRSFVQRPLPLEGSPADR